MRNKILEYMFHNIDTLIFLIDSGGNIKECNDVVFECLNLDKNYFENENIFDFILDKDKLKLFLKEDELKDSWEINFVFKEKIEALECKIMKYGESSILLCKIPDPSVLELQEELMHINNKITNLYRQIEKKNMLLEKANKKLEIKNKQIDEKNKELDFQLSIAQKIQRHLVKKGPIELYNYVFDSTYVPAQNIGGDYYDIVDLDDGKIGLFLSDVSGHGISSALIMIIVKTLFSENKDKYMAPKLLIEKLNKELFNMLNKNLNSLYSTAFYCIIDTVNMTIEYCNAGHPSPIVYNDTVLDEMKSTGMPIGMFEQSTYANNTINIDKENKMSFFTDGFSELVLKFINKKQDYTNMINILNKEDISLIDDIIKKTHDDFTLINGKNKTVD